MFGPAEKRSLAKLGSLRSLQTRRYAMELDGIDILIGQNGMMEDGWMDGLMLHYAEWLSRWMRCRQRGRCHVRGGG